MTENMKKLLEALSANEELREKVNTAKTKEEVIELAKELDVPLTEKDFASADGEELTEEELSAVAGGGGFCLIVGFTDQGCGCVIYGDSFDESVCIVIGTGGSSYCGSSADAGYF